MLHVSHFSFEASLILTHDYKTSKAAHQRLEQILKSECNKVMNIDYGLQMAPDTLLRIADTEKWLLQSELKAIQDGLIYVDKR